MDIYSLTGHSGTGKSHHAPIFARDKGIRYIIDDGLLIKGNLNLAGRSAKRESTRYGAIKRALFKDPEHAEQVKEKLAEIKPERLLILGTSRRMTEVIAENLSLPHPTFYYTIEEIADTESIKTALAIRKTENRHVIPLPTFAIKKEFPGYIIDPLRSFFNLQTVPTAGFPVERSVVRPVFSTLGSFYIAEHVIIELIEHIVVNFPGVFKVLAAELNTGDNKVVLNIDLSIDLTGVPNMKIDALLQEIQRSIKEDVEFQTGFYLDEVNVHAKKLHLDEDMIKDKDALHRLITARNIAEQ